MYNTHLYGGEGKDELLEEIKNRFQEIYESITSIEKYVDEDDVLTYTLRVFFNSLGESNALNKITYILSGVEYDPIVFIKEFTEYLAKSFAALKTFFCEDGKEYIEVHSLVTLGRFGIVIPFIVKAYNYGLLKEEICSLCSALETLVLRHRLIGTKANLITRIEDVYEKFNAENHSIKDICDRINLMKIVPGSNWWYAYWNNDALEYALRGGLEHSIAKYILWKYENWLKNNGKSGYSFTRFDSIDRPHLEHIAPQKPTDGEPIAAGYSVYDEKFVMECIDCLGNYLLLSAPHNESIGNKSFKQIKRPSYTQLIQQLEIVKLTENDEVWDRAKIETRNNVLKEYVLNNI
ncbi:HNH endonuclease family protein [Treponema primitia]|uniref:HNH endonuclease family protein n=1 Tax=Treponema primitia TaxID=88058 RepID=UPI00397F0ECD